MTTTSSIVAAIALLGCGGCAMQATEDEPAEEVVPQSEALNSAANFKIGIQTWLQNTGGSFPQTPPMSEIAMGSGLGGSAWSALPNSWTNPNGLRISLTRLTSGISLESVDFRIGILATDTGDAKFGDPQWTGWASDGGGWSRGAMDGGDHIDADFFAVVMQVRSWPAGNNKRLKDIAVAIQACEMSFSPPSFHNCDTQWGINMITQWLSQIPLNQTWATSVATNQFGYSIDGARIRLITSF